MCQFSRGTNDAPITQLPGRSFRRGEPDAAWASGLAWQAAFLGPREGDEIAVPCNRDPHPWNGWAEGVLGRPEPAMSEVLGNPAGHRRFRLGLCGSVVTFRVLPSRTGTSARASMLAVSEAL